MFGWDDALSMGLEAGLSYFGNNMLAGQANESSAKAAAASYANNMKAFQRRYQDTVVDMRAAGLNPILAASGGFNVSGAPTMPMAQSFPGTMSFGHNLSSTAKDYQDVEQSKTEVQKKEVEINNIMQDTAKKKEEVKETIERTLKTRAETGKITQEEMLIGRQIINTIEDTMKKTQEIRLMRAEIIRTLSQADLNDQQKLQVKSDISRLNQQTSLLKQSTRNLETEYERLKKMSWHYSIPVWGHFVSGINNLLNFGGGAPAAAGINAIK